MAWWAVQRQATRSGFAALPETQRSIETCALHSEGGPCERLGLGNGPALDPSRGCVIYWTIIG